MTKKLHALVVGAGFAGAAYARTLADRGLQVAVIEKREHLGGNAHDYVDSSGTRVHRYGPHLFHTNNEQVVGWVKQWGEWVAYDHRVRALLPSGKTAPLPINRRTLEAVFDVVLPDATAAEQFLARVAEPTEQVTNAADYLHSRIGSQLTNLFFRPYTKKMWDLDLEDLDPSVVKRLPLRFDDEDRYFPGDQFQLMPRYGYTPIFERIFDHPNIKVHINQSFVPGMETAYDCAFLSMPIDEYYDYRFGALPYRSIRFDDRLKENQLNMTWAVTNYTDDGLWTRETCWHMIPFHGNGSTLGTHTREQPCDYTENDFERYYPVRTSDGRFQKVYDQYLQLASKSPMVVFIGRCGTYQYLDMHQVINQSLQGAEKWLQRHA